MTVDNRYDGRGSEPPYESRECVEMRERTTAMVIELEQLEKQLATLTARLAAAEKLNEPRMSLHAEIARLQEQLADERTARMSLETEQALIEETLKHLRGLLREACEMARAPDDDPERWYGNEIPDEWFDAAQAALEAKQ